MSELVWRDEERAAERHRRETATPWAGHWACPHCRAVVRLDEGDPVGRVEHPSFGSGLGDEQVEEPVQRSFWAPRYDDGRRWWDRFFGTGPAPVERIRSVTCPECDWLSDWRRVRRARLLALEIPEGVGGDACAAGG